MSLDWEYTKAHVLAYVKQLESKKKTKSLGLRLNLTKEIKPVAKTEESEVFPIYGDKKYKGD